MFSKNTVLAAILASVAVVNNVDAFGVHLNTFSAPSATQRFVGMSAEIGEESSEVEDFIVSSDDLSSADSTSAMDSDAVEVEPSGPFLHAQRLSENRIKFRLHEKDVGSPEFQVAGMTERISYLTSHLKENPKDFSTRRGLVALVNKRRRLLNYLFTEDVNRYTEIVSALGIRHKAPSNVESREDKYGRFPKQKSQRK